jgi:hypothetical protein
MRLRTMAAVVFGVVLVALGVVVGLGASQFVAGGVPVWLTVLVALVVLPVVAVKLLRTPGGEDTAPAPWSEGGAIVATRPESTPETDRIVTSELSERITSAATQARWDETVEARQEMLREPLREALVGALQQGGWDHDRIDAALASGEWTDDPVAAAVVDERVAPPVRSLRRRVWAWLFPEKAIRHRTARTVGAISRRADSDLPPVVGQHAPRPVPVVEPTVDDLQRAADGTLRRAVEGAAAVRTPDGERDDENAAQSDPSADSPTDADDSQAASSSRTERADWTETEGSD